MPRSVATMRQLRRLGVAPRPAWRIRGVLDPALGFAGPIACLELPRGRAATAGDALFVANREHPAFMCLLPADQWRAFPVEGVAAVDPLARRTG